MYSVKDIQTSLVIPMKDESTSLAKLIVSIENQSFHPAEIILVDGGSMDNTVELARQFSLKNSRIQVIKTLKASPGKGRNIGIENAKNEWIALTDAGIKLEIDWLEKLVEVAKTNPDIDIIYGNYSPVIGSFFEKCAMFTYVPPLREDAIRGKFIASCLMKKKVWEEVGGFPDLRAAEDLMFMEAIEKQGFKYSFAPKAMVYWQLRPNLASTFQKFMLYSKHNIWADRAWDWHYGVAKQYLIITPFIVLTVFHNWFWIMGIVAWIAARTTNRILLHNFEFGIKTLFNPLIFCGVAFLVLTIDAATFIGWIEAILNKNKN